MDRLKIIKTFEGFHLDELKNLISNSKTYIKKKIRILEDDGTNEYNSLVAKIKEYDLSKFKIDDKSYGIFIYPDDEFLSLYEKLCNITKEDYNNDLNFYITICDERDNLIDFDGGIPNILRGASIGYKLYKLVIKLKKYITSNKHSSFEAYNLWYNLLMDNDLYALTSNDVSVLIDKKIDDEELTKLSYKYKGLEMSNDLINKLKMI